MNTDIFLKGKRPYLWIALAVILVYGQILFFKLTFLDDYTYIVENSIFFAHFSNIFRVFTTDFNAAVTGGVYYRPLLAASLIFNASIAGQNPFFFHLTDLFLHLGVCLLLYKFLLRIFDQKPAALFGSLIFAVHPLLVQTVAWIPARNDSLLALFVLWYLLAYSEKKYWQAALAMFLALASKETAVMIPVLSFLYTWWISEKSGKYREMLKFVPMWIILLAAWAIGRAHLINKSAAMGIRDMIYSVYVSSPAVVHYLGKMLLPFNLSDYPVMADITLTLGLISLALLALGYLLSKQKRNSHVIFGLAWFFIFLLPSLVRKDPISYSEILEHRAYLPMIGILIFMLEWDWFKKSWLANRMRFTAASAVLLIFTVINIAHAVNFRNGLAYWKQAVRSSPHSSFAAKQVGAMWYFEKNVIGAEMAYKKAIELNPEETLVHSNLGLIYVDEGRYAEAKNLYLEEIAVNPNYDKVYFNLGYLYWLEKKPDDAASFWLKTLETNPYHFNAYQNLAVYYYQAGRFADGVKMLTELVRHGGQIDPNLLRDYRPYWPKD